MTNCEHCITGIAKWQCLDCYNDGEESLMCDDCKNEHEDAQIGESTYSGGIISI